MAASLEHLPLLLEGLLVTVQLSVGGATVAVLAAFAAGTGRISRARILRWAAATYVETFRGTSALVQLFWAYFALPLLGIRLGAMTTGVLVLGLNAGAYGAEVVRGALLAVPREQREAARALSLTERQILWRVLLPQALPAILPPGGNVLIELLKNTSLASLITLGELTFQGQVLRAESLRTVEIFTLLLAMYFGLSLVLVYGLRVLERRVQRHLRMEPVR